MRHWFIAEVGVNKCFVGFVTIRISFAFLACGVNVWNFNGDKVNGRETADSVCSLVGIGGLT